MTPSHHSEDSGFASLAEGFLVGAGRFTLRRLLGRGGMGVVWLARDEQLHEDVALKFLPPEIRHDAVGLDDLRRETARSRKLTHPNIIRIHDFYKAEHEAFISMEFVDGPNLADLHVAQTDRVFTWEYLVPLVKQLCDALDYAHGERIVHRDLKPANMMLDGRGRLKLADFGIAAAIVDSGSRVSMRHAQSGTSTYMSPQQMDGRLPQVSDDIYALGATLYELLTSRPPFFSGDIPHQVRNLSPQPIDERLAELGIRNPVPADVAALIMACLAKDPAQRPESARAVAEWIGLQPSTARRVEQVTSPVPSSRQPRPTSSVRVEPMREIPTIETTFDEAVDSTTGSASEEVIFPRERSRWPAIVATGVALLFVLSGLGWWLFQRSRKENSAELVSAPVGSGSFASSVEPQVLSGHTGTITDIKCSSDQRYIVSADGDGSVRVWSTWSGNLLWTSQVHTNRIAAVAISRDNQLLAAAAGPSGRVLRLSNGEEIGRFAHEVEINDLAFSPRDSLIASVDVSGVIALRDARSGTVAKQWKGQFSGIRCVAFSPDGANLLTGGDDQTVRVWNVATGNMVKSISGHRGVVWSVAWSPNGELIATCSRDRSLRIWHANTWSEKRVAQWNSDANLMQDIAFSPDSRFVAATSPKHVKIYQVQDASRGRDRAFDTPAGTTRAVAFSRDGRSIVIGGADKLVRVLPFGGDVMFGSTEPAFYDFTPIFNGQDLAGWKGNTRVWSVANGVLRGELRDRTDANNGDCLFWTGDALEDFELRFKFRLLKAGNAGVFFRGAELPNFSAGGYQYEIMRGNAGNLLEVGNDRPRRDVYRQRFTGPLDEWHEAGILAIGSRIVHTCDGQLLLDVDDNFAARPRLGMLALEVTGGPAIVEFKDIRLRRIPRVP